MHLTLLTNEYPPNVYGGAGVHVEYLTRELARLDDRSHRIEVFSFGDQKVDDENLSVRGIEAPVTIAAQEARHVRLMDTLTRDLVMAGRVDLESDVVHCHTWYSHLAGCLAKQLTGAKLVLTTHSLEPHRPWKVEQLGSAYHASSWIERTAYQTADGVIAVSEAMKEDVMQLYGVPEERVHVIPNGIDPDEYRSRHDPDVLRRHGVDPDVPYVLFVGRITRQKGIIHLVRALPHLDEGMQIVLAAGAPDTPEIAAEMQAAVGEARQSTANPIVWIDAMLPREEIITLYSHAAVFVCPSVYEPFGIINLEAMACEVPVVASAVGGIRSIVVEGETGLLVPLESRGEVDFEPRDPEAFARAIARAANELMADADRRTLMGGAGRKRVVEHFSWRSVAERTLGVYRALAE